MQGAASPQVVCEVFCTNPSGTAPTCMPTLCLRRAVDVMDTTLPGPSMAIRYLPRERKDGHLSQGSICTGSSWHKTDPPAAVGIANHSVLWWYITFPPWDWPRKKKKKKTRG